MMSKLKAILEFPTKNMTQGTLRTELDPAFQWTQHSIEPDL